VTLRIGVRLRGAISHRARTRFEDDDQNFEVRQKSTGEYVRLGTLEYLLLWRSFGDVVEILQRRDPILARRTRQRIWVT